MHSKLTASFLEPDLEHTGVKTPILQILDIVEVNLTDMLSEYALWQILLNGKFEF